MRRGTLAALALACLVPAPAWGQGVRVEGPDTSPPYRLVRLRLEGEFRSAVWFVTPLGSADAEPGGTRGERLVFTAPPGRYDLLIVFNDAAGNLGQLQKTVAIGTTPGPTPGPEPPPPPPPPPPTPVVEGRLYVSYVVPESPTPDQAAVRTDPVLRASLADLDAAWRTYLASESDLDRLRLRPVVQAAGLPCAIIQDERGKVIATIKSPTGQAIAEQVRQLRGR